MKGCFSLLAAVALTLVVCSATYADPVAIDFGDPITGAFTLTPNDVTVNVGDVVTFNVHGNHDITIYRVDPATMRPDIDTNIMPGMDYTITDAVPSPIVNTASRDAENPNIVEDHFTSPLLFLGAKPGDLDPGTVVRDQALSANITFLVPGRYLVLCGVKNHLDSGMYGFVTVLGP